MTWLWEPWFLKILLVCPTVVFLGCISIFSPWPLAAMSSSPRLLRLREIAYKFMPNLPRDEILHQLQASSAAVWKWCCDFAPTTREQVKGLRLSLYAMLPYVRTAIVRYMPHKYDMIWQALFLCNICVVFNASFAIWKFAFYPRLDKCHRQSQIFSVSNRRFWHCRSFGII